MSRTFDPSNEQRNIIQYPAEPLRVAAGAGTGKTTTIVERIAHLVRNDLDPARILGVTFTNKAADELRHRVLGTLGLDAADRIPEIATYHGFAASILDEFGAFVGYSSTSMLMDEGHRSELADRVLRSLPTAGLDLTVLSQLRSELLSLASAITDNLALTSDIREAAPSNLDESDRRGADEDGDDKAREAWIKRLALTDAVDAYEAEKRRLGLMEFGDLIRLAVQVVSSAPEVAAEIGLRYDAVVLDEYQDTDPAQRRLLTMLFAERVPVVAVGDTDQTIYEWRGASAENFASFPADFPRTEGRDAETLPLSVNRRSERLILDLANTIRNEIPPGAGALPLAPSDTAGPGEVVTAWFNTQESESQWIAQEIESSHEAGTPWSESGVLCKTRAQFGPVVAALMERGIPFSVASMGQLLSIPEVADLLGWLRILDDRRNETSLLRIWMGGRFRIGMKTVASLRTWCRGDETRTLLDAALHHAEVPDLTDEARGRITTFIAMYSELVATSQVASVSSTIDAIIESLGYWDEIAALDSGPGLTAKLNVGKFTDLAQRWRPLDGAPTLGRFLRYLTALDEPGRAEALAAAIPTHADAVSLTTIHSAKGLEWSHVYIPGVAERVFPGTSQLLDDPERFGQLLPYELRLDSEVPADAAAATGSERSDILRKRFLHQEWRVAYVAVTRAAERIALTGHAWDKAIKKPRQPSPLWQLAHDLPDATHGPMETISDAQPERQPFVPSHTAPDPFFSDGPAAALRHAVKDSRWIYTEYPELVDAASRRVRQLELSINDLAQPIAVTPPSSFTTSVTNLVLLAGCAQKFKWIHHDRLPQKPRRSAIFGTAFHRRIEMHNLGVIAFDDPETEAPDAGAAGEAEAQGAADPWKLFRDSRYWIETPIHIEAPFEISVGEGSIRGKIDAIYATEGGGWEIVDYKSGRDRSSPARNVQLEVYAIAASDGALSSSPPESIDVTFAYFGGGELAEVTESVDKEWLDRARDHVAGLVDIGINGPFDPQPSQDCQWCDFLHLCPAGQQMVGNPKQS